MKHALFVLFLGLMILVPVVAMPTASASNSWSTAGGTWSATGSMSTPRAAFTATLLRNGKVLVAGGYENGIFLGTAELYVPGKGH